MTFSVLLLASALSCTGAVDPAQGIGARKGRLVFCAVDVGSSTTKLQVVSMEARKPLSFVDERQCRVRLGLGALAADAATGEKKAIPPAESASLAGIVKELQQICARDKGEMLGVAATQWARDATNVEDVRQAVKAATGLDMEVLTAEWEGHFGYTAGTRNEPGRFALDPGGSSFEVSWWPKGAKVARTASVPFGYATAARTYYPPSEKAGFAEARAAHAADIEKQLEAALSALKPPSSLAQLREEVKRGALAPEIYVTGQDGALHLAIRGELRDAQGRWIDTAAAYDARVSAAGRVSHDRFGKILGVLAPEDVAAFLRGVAAEPALRSEAVRSLYGERALANAVLLDVLAQKLGVKTIVLVPQEMPVGYILYKLAMGA